MLPRFQELVLRAVRQKGPNCRANEIQEDLTNLLGREQAFGAVFTTLDRLTAKGFVKWRKGVPDDRRGGRAPRLYEITGDGISALSETARINYVLHQSGGKDVVADPVPV